nr:hypothetical protein [Tanacetum cinerariifolium]
MQQNSKVDSVLDDNMITYDEYQNDSGVEDVPTVVYADEVDKQSMIAVLQRMHTEIPGYVRVNDEHKLVNATLIADLERCKIEMQALERNKVKNDLDMAIVVRCWCGLTLASPSILQVQHLAYSVQLWPLWKLYGNCLFSYGCL